eukprot:gene2786-4194_t
MYSTSALEEKKKKQTEDDEVHEYLYQNDKEIQHFQRSFVTLPLEYDQKAIIYADDPYSIGSILFWVGCWDLMESEELFETSFQTEIITFSVGTIIFAFLQLFCQLPYIKRVSTDPKYKYSGMIIRTIRDTMAVFLVVAVWKSLYNVFEYYLWAETLLRCLLYTFVGYFCLIMTDTLTHNTAL